MIPSDPRALLVVYRSLQRAIEEAGGSLDVIDLDAPLYEVLDILGRNGIVFVYIEKEEQSDG